MSERSSDEHDYILESGEKSQRGDWVRFYQRWKEGIVDEHLQTL